MAVDSQKQLLGFVLLVVSSAVMLAGGVSDIVPAVAGAPAALGLAAGALLVGTAAQGRPV
ncbi:hypothetical protein Hrd1104_02630 [Halorhabdus sp. CBA1104]|uniref:hypothetical protein n=1 Tax=unclassified Halorhabdus TaxID=2621901 RepID=UPI0012B3D9D1|nr:MULTISPECIES: hypothetical protein [unclassified Halorhabdus]QGN06294.1 hypothetical protein Hrd1104_02630 [Halorhabdus sp. CBA1104]